MAQIRLDLNQFKASGVYTLEFDMSENITLNSQTVRLIVGFSRKGPFNAPVFLPDKKTALQVFGEIDPFLEKNGSYFHRALFTALEVGPVFGLNLMWLDNDPTTGDKAEYQSFSLSSLEQNGVKKSELLSSYYNKERFWFPDQEYFLANVNSDGSLNSGSILNIVNLSQTPVTMLIRKTNSIRQFNVTAVEWYGEGNVPPYVDPSDFISDYFVEVSLIQGDWTNYTKLSNDLIFGKYFNQFGLKKSYYKEFLDLEEVRTLGVFTGSIIPELRDSLGTNFAIDTIINSTLASTGVFVAIDKDALENYSTYNDESSTDEFKSVDLVGHGLANTINISGQGDPTPNSLNFLSYSANVNNRFEYTLKNNDFSVVLNNTNILKSNPYGYTYYDPASLLTAFGSLTSNDIKYESLHIGGNYGYLNNVISLKVSDTELSAYKTFKNSIKLGSSLIGLDSDLRPTVSNDSDFYTADYPFGVISQLYEQVDDNNITWLKIVYQNTNKANEKSSTAAVDIKGIYKSGTDVYAFVTSADVDYRQLAEKEDKGSQILIETPDFRGYFNFEILETNPNDGDPIGNGVDYYTYDLSVYTSYKFLKLTNGNFTGLRQSVGGHSTTLTSLSGHLTEETDIKMYDGSLSNVTQKTYFAYKPNSFTNAGSGTANDYPIIITNPDFVELFNGANDVIYANKETSIYKDWASGALSDGSLIKTSTAALYFTFDKVSFGGVEVLRLTPYTTRTTIYKANGEFDKYQLSNQSATLVLDGDGGLNAGGEFGIYPGTNVDIYGVSVDLYSKISYQSVGADGLSFRLSATDANKLQVTDFVVSKIVIDSETTKYKLSRILSKRKIDTITYEYKINQPLFTDNGLFVKFNEIDEFVSFYKLFSLSGFKLQSKHLPGGSDPQAQLTKILGMLDSVNSNLGEVLKDRDVIQFRYIVDTFDGGLYPMTYPKTYLTKLAKERQKCLALMNTPSMRLFRNSNDPKFTEATTPATPKPVLNTAYIAEGANNSLGPSFTFSLPDEFNGSKFAGYFSPFLAIRENGRTIYIPPAAHVSNLFVQKFVNGTPFHIVAGPKRGVISEPKLVGLEYDFLLKDRENLEPIGINPIVKKRGVGYMIYGNQMAYQKTKSAFNNLHVRDLLITIEEAIEDLLGRYLFDFNNPTTRIEIKNQVDAYLDKVRALQGIYTFETRMDETNNGAEIIRENMGIIDIAIEPQMGFHKFINRVHVYQYGGIQSTGFDVQNVII